MKYHKIPKVADVEVSECCGEIANKGGSNLLVRYRYTCNKCGKCCKTMTEKRELN